jgi:hypothetical protein
LFNRLQKNRLHAVQPVLFLLLACAFSWTAQAQLAPAPAEAELRPPMAEAGASALQGPQAAYIQELVTRADASRLFEDPTWRNLVHYRKGWGGYVSLVDDPKFFNAPGGKHNPRAELAATIQAFFQPASTNEAEHPVCRFVARYTWLKEQLGIDPAQLPVPVCERFEKVRAYLDASEVTLVYPAAYMNGPASMFGHTLLVFDAAKKNRLLSRAVSYAAKTDTKIGPLFAFAGIAGLYPGYYAIQPYYEKVEQYGDIGHRDVWEYELDFTPAEVDRMIHHAWELQGIWSRYFFFDENCAYKLYFFLDVARPSLRLADNDPWFIIPMDTVKVVNRAGLIKKVEYRPSPVTRIKHMAALVSREERALALDVARGRKQPEVVLEAITNREEQAVVLDLASEYTQYLYTEERLSKEAYSPRFIDTLKVRSKLGKTPDAYTEVPPPPRPDRGHGPYKFSFGGGAMAREAFLSLRGRVAYHALVDNHEGFEKGAEIQFMNTEGRYYFEQDAFELQSLDIVGVQSIAPRDDFFKPFSWKVAFGATQFDREENQDNLVGQARTGAGVAYAPKRLDLIWLWFEGAALGGSSLDRDFAVGCGPAAGIMYSSSKNWKRVLQARANYFFWGDEFWNFALSWQHDYRLSRSSSLGLDLSRELIDERYANTAHLRWNWYF